MAPIPRMRPEPDAELIAAAALLLLHPHAGKWHIPLTIRGSTCATIPDETIEAAAPREACEETGVRPGAVEILGRLRPIPIAVSGHLLHPVVGAAAARPDFTLAEDEVDRLIELPVAALIDDLPTGVSR